MDPPPELPPPPLPLLQPLSTVTAAAHTEPSNTTIIPDQTSLPVSSSLLPIPTDNDPKGARHLTPAATRRGRKTTWPPKKLQWLNSHVSQCLVSKNRSAFYDRILWLWRRLFGRSLPVKEDPEGDIDEAAAIARQEQELPLTAEEEKADSELREVQSFSLSFSVSFYTLRGTFLS